MQDVHYDVAIIGGGPGGCSAAIWLKMLGFRPVLVEQKPHLGGLQSISPYQNPWIATSPFVTGHDIAGAMQTSVIGQHNIPTLLNAQVTAVEGRGEHFQLALRHNGAPSQLRARKIVLATGVRPATGGLKETQHLLIGPGKKIAEAALEGRRVAILGGGDNGGENYFFVKSQGAAEVKLFARNLKMRLEFLKNLPAADVTLGAYEVDPEAMTVNGQSFDYIFVFYGWRTCLDFVSSLPLEKKDNGMVLTDANCETSVPGVFAIGESAARMHPCCVTAMADGVVAAKAIQAQLEQNERGLALAALLSGAATL
jgi:thioredoxin reductase